MGEKAASSGDTIPRGEPVWTEEQAAIDARRDFWGGGGFTTDMLGLALSGGGIRSATFSLGVLRELSALKKLHRFDYLSTVSGGTYIGAFFCGLFVPRETPTPEQRLNLDKPTMDPLGSDAGNRAIGLLRQSGRYLAPSGTVDYWYAVALLTRNWIGLHIVIGSTIVALTLIGAWGRWLDTVRPHWTRPIAAGLPPFPAIALAILAATLALGWSYWLTRRDVGARSGRGLFAQIGTLVLVAICIGLTQAAGGNPIAALVAILGTTGFAIWALAYRNVAGTAGWRGTEPSAAMEEAWDTQRVWITRWQSRLLATAALAGGFAAIDWLAFTIASWDQADLALKGSALTTAILVPAARTLIARAGQIPPQVQGALRAIAARAATMLAALLLLAIVVLFWTVSAYRLTWAEDPTTARDRLLVATLIVTVLCVAIRGTGTFLNLSSLATFYAGRLRRAYLGAGNPARLYAETGVEKGQAGDEIQLIDYYQAPRNGAPLHIINVTLNETIAAKSTIVQRDRHGRNVTLTPIGIVRAGDAEIERIPYGDDRQEERLPLSTWIGISGAAFSTGLGARTGFGLTTLAGLANVRLGYWWRAGSDSGDRGVQAYLFDELFGRFRGAQLPRWYLSDGGHFENTGVYELIRRKLPFILASDNGQDESYAYEDVANLVRKARIDFGAEIGFLDGDALDRAIGRFTKARAAFGTLAQIGGAEPAAPSAVAALARIDYGKGQCGTLVLIKPRLTGDGSADLMRYKAENRDFPQQTTLDQFFDEAQWESYYTLGRHITRIVMGPSDGRWYPGALQPL